MPVAVTLKFAGLPSQIACLATGGVVIAGKVFTVKVAAPLVTDGVQVPPTITS